MPRYAIQDEGDRPLRELPKAGEKLEIEIGTADDKPNEKDDDFDPIDPRFGEDRGGKGDDARARERDEEEDEDYDEGSDDPDEDEGDDEAERRPRSKFERRLDRERRIVRETREENRELRERLEHIEKSLLKRNSEEEIAKAKQESEKKLADLRTRLKKAKEEGDTDVEVEIAEQIAEVKADLKAKEILAAQAKETDESAPKTNRVQRLARQWIRKHARYNSDPTFKAYVQAVDAQVARDGFDPEDEEYYEELDRRVAERFPEEYRKSKRNNLRHPSEERDDAGPGKRQSGKRDLGSFRRQGKKVILSPAQVENMRRFGLDPDDKADVEAYVRENLSSTRP